MAFQDCVNIAEFAIRQQLNGVIINNVIHAYRSSGWDAAGMNLIAGNIYNAYNTYGKGSLSQDWSFLSIACRDLTNEFGQVTEYTGAPMAGTVAVEAIPNSGALCLSLRTAYRGRSYRGRAYQAGAPVSTVTDGLFGVSWVGEMLTLWDGVKAACTAVVGGKMVVLSRYHDGVKRGTGLGADVIDIKATREVSSQRRRKVPSSSYQS